MNESTPPLEVSEIAVQAARWWLALQESASPRQQRAFLTWLRESPRHVEEYLLVSTACEEFTYFDGSERFDLKAIRGAAFANVVQLPVLEERGGYVQLKWLRWLPRWSVGVGALIAMLLAAVLWQARPDTRYATAIGEQRALQLEDGSLLHLNVSSAVNVNFTTAARELKLLSGEALFTVAPQPARPFRVRVGATLIEAIGTAFDVERLSHGTVVSVLEGAVRVRALGIRSSGVGPSDATVLRAGQRVHLTPEGRVLKVSAVDADGALAWQQRRLVFEGTPLSEVVAQFNRYNRTPVLRVADAPAGEMRLMGIFNADDPQSLLLFIDGIPNLSVQRTDAEVLIRSRAVAAAARPQR